jgi:hypothetical protein
MTDTVEFLPAFGNRPAKLIGRDQVVQSFLKGLSCPIGHPDRATILIGQRGMGKTALLLEFADRSNEQDFIVARATASDTLLDDLLGAIQLNGSSVISKRPKLKGVSAGAFGFSIGLTFSEEAGKELSFLNKMLLLSNELEKYGKGIVILVDEIQAHTPALRTLTTTYQHLVGENKNVVIAMAGLPHAISSLLSDAVLTFFNRATKVFLASISLSEVSVYFSQVLTNLGKKISPENLEKVAEGTRGYPYLIQLIGFYLLEYSQSASEITAELVELALKSAKRDMIDNVYAPILKPLSKKDEEFLRAMARDSEVSKISEIKKRLRASDGVVHTYRKRLLDAGVIVSEKRGELSFTLPYFAEYLRGTF